MDLTIANISTQVSSTQLDAAIAAISSQVTNDFQPEWGAGANLRGISASLQNGGTLQGNTDAIIYLGDSSQDPTTGIEGALGYHFRTHAGVPYGFVYLDICAMYDEEWSCTLSHEVLELLADPTAALTVAGPAPQTAAAPPPAGAPGSSVYYDLEVCDPTQGDTYTIAGITVSNFVGRKYFDLTGGNGQTNHLNLPLVPFGVRPGGYYQYEDGNGAHQIQGQKVTARQLEGKKLMGRGRRNARRRERVRRLESGLKD
jgi:hypothetical protein